MQALTLLIQFFKYFFVVIWSAQGNFFNQYLKKPYTRDTRLWSWSTRLTLVSSNPVSNFDKQLGIFFRKNLRLRQASFNGIGADIWPLWKRDIFTSLHLSSKYTGLHKSDSLPLRNSKLLRKFELIWRGRLPDRLGHLWSGEVGRQSWIEETDAKATFGVFTLFYYRFLFCVISKDQIQNEDVCSFFLSCHVPIRRVCRVQAWRYI